MVDEPRPCSTSSNMQVEYFGCVTPCGEHHHYYIIRYYLPYLELHSSAANNRSVKSFQSQEGTATVLTHMEVGTPVHLDRMNRYDCLMRHLNKHSVMCTYVRWLIFVVWGKVTQRETYISTLSEDRERIGENPESKNAKRFFTPPIVL